MRNGLIMLAAMFVNFFGFYIVEIYVAASGTVRATPFIPNDYTAGSVVDMAAVFVICLGIAILLRVFYFGRNKNYAHYRYVYRKKAAYWLVVILLLGVGCFNLSNVDLAFSMHGRGYDQFSRDIKDALSRFSLLLLPIFIFFRVGYSDDRVARLVTLFFLLSVAVKSISLGDRRELVYYGLAYMLIRYRAIGEEGGWRLKSWKRNMLLVFSLALIVSAYYFRAGGDFEIGYVLLQSTFGALGIGAILPEVKRIIATDTGFLMGASFFTYFWTLFVPSFLLYAIGGSEFIYRSSYIFNNKFNDNPDMGYDFMLLADFYWNFGYIGYFFYIFNFALCYFFVVGAANSKNDFKFAASILVVVFFVAAQRSDFGLFMKSVFYCQVMMWLLYRACACKERRAVL